MNKTRENIVLTPRDLLIFHTLNELGFCSSRNLKNIVSPETQHKTFNIRLLLLKKHGFIKELKQEYKSISQYSIYMLNTTEIVLNRIYYETGIKYEPSIYNTSYTLYNHQLLLGDLFVYFLGKIRNKNKDFVLKAEYFTGSKTIQKILQTELKNPETKYEYLDFVMIPDLLLSIGNTAYCLELENMNSYKQFHQKVLGYEDMNTRKNNKKFFPLFREKNLILIVSCWDYKKEKYEEILKENFTGKYAISLL
ncbi:MAG: hypothetical protein HHAS10_12060 [Candidatus Altimarinota bacterium]